MTRHAARCRGTTLVEILFLITMAILFFELAGQMFQQARLAERDCRETTFIIGRYEHAIDLLRRDVWESRRIDPAQPAGLALTLGDGRTVRWAYDPTDQALTRDDGHGAPQRWANLACRVELQKSPGNLEAVVVKLEGGAARSTDEIWLTSQLAMTVHPNPGEKQP